MVTPPCSLFLSAQVYETKSSNMAWLRCRSLHPASEDKHCITEQSDFTAKPTAPEVAPRCETESECVDVTNASAEVPATIVSSDVKRRNETLSLLSKGKLYNTARVRNGSIERKRLR